MHRALTPEEIEIGRILHLEIRNPKSQIGLLKLRRSNPIFRISIFEMQDSSNFEMSVEGHTYRPLVSPDGTKIFYLVRRAVVTKENFRKLPMNEVDLTTEAQLH